MNCQLLITLYMENKKDTKVARLFLNQMTTSCLTFMDILMVDNTFCIKIIICEEINLCMEEH